jgi:5-methyltetrahydropteroyltriglutamate--homocysteine methyltransferase
MFACLAGGYPREPLPAQPDHLGEAIRAVGAGELDESGWMAAADAFVQEILDEQLAAGMGVLTDGGARWESPFDPVITGLRGLEAGSPTALFGTGLRVPRPIVSGPIAWEGPIYRSAWISAAAGRSVPVKQVIPGPYTLAKLSQPGAVRRESVTLALAEALNAELRDLVAAGCQLIQVDEDALVAIEADPTERGLVREGHRRLLAGLEDPTLVHLSLAISGGDATAAGMSTLFDAPWSSHLFDLVAGPANWQLVLQLPRGRGIVCGVGDAQSAAIDDVEAIVYAIAWAARSTGDLARVGIAPSGSLRLLDRHAARRKIECLALAIQVASMGPIEEVAESLEPHPRTTSRYPDLARSAEAYEAALAALGWSGNADPLRGPLSVNQGG